MYVLSNTTLFDGRDMYRIYYTKNNKMFQHSTMAIFRLRNEKTAAIFDLCGDVRGEEGTRSHMCYVGWAVWVHGSSAIICYV